MCFVCVCGGVYVRESVCIRTCGCVNTWDTCDCVHTKRAREGRYAFIWDTPTIRHEISNDCNLMEVGSSFDNKGYGFAFQKHAPYSERLSWALLKLNDAGILYRLERK